MNANQITGSLRHLASEIERTYDPTTPMVTISPGEIRCEPTGDGEFMVLKFSPSERSAKQVEVHLLLSGDDEERILRALGRA